MSVQFCRSRLFTLLGRSNSSSLCRVPRQCLSYRGPASAPSAGRVPRPFQQPLLHHPRARTHQSLNGQIRPSRRFSTDSQGAGGGKGSKPPEGEGGNFFQNFAQNIRKAMKGNEVQESLKGFNEEREKMKQSYVIQQAKLKWSAMVEGLGKAASRSSEEANKGWSAVKKTSSKVSSKPWLMLTCRMHWICRCTEMFLIRRWGRRDRLLAVK